MQVNAIKCMAFRLHIYRYLMALINMLSQGKTWSPTLHCIIMVLLSGGTNNCKRQTIVMSDNCPFWLWIIHIFENIKPNIQDKHVGVVKIFGERLST